MVKGLKRLSVKMKSEEETSNWSEIVEQPIPCLRLQGRKWKYRGEGNANLVIALPEERLILRLHKWELGKEVTEEDEMEEKQRGWREAVFCRTVMVPLLGRAYIQPPVCAKIDNIELVHLDQALRPFRPVYRIHKKIQFGYVTVFPDYALLPLNLKKTGEDLNNMNTIETKNITLTHSLEENLNVLLLQTKHCSSNMLPFNPRENRIERVLEQYSMEIGNNVGDSGSNENVQNIGSTGIGVDETRYIVNKTTNQNVNTVFCIEIKPKQGWIHFNNRCNKKCTFCLTQYLKLSKGTVDGISQYCPLDLFSGNEFRMMKSIKALLFTPQNNLKIFKGGHLVYSDDIKSDLMVVLKEWFAISSNDFTLDDSDRIVNRFCNLVYQALTKDLTSGEQPPIIEDVPGIYPFKDEDGNILPASPVITSLQPFLDFSRSCDWSSQLLPSNCILDRILRIQQLQQSSVNTVYEMYKKRIAVESDFSYIDSLCCQSNPKKLMLDPIQRYLLATTAKDCSILIAFQQINNQDVCSEVHKVTDTDGISYIWNIGVSDLDPKPLSCIEKHRKRDIEIIASCLEYYKNNSSC